MTTGELMSQVNDDAEPDSYCEGVRFFNIYGPCEPERHYMIPPEPRLPTAPELIEEGQYFVVHAPRQTGKTTTLYALERDLNAGGEYAALAVSCEQASAAGDDHDAATNAILVTITEEAEARPTGSRARSQSSPGPSCCPTADSTSGSSSPSSPTGGGGTANGSPRARCTTRSPRS